VFNGRHRRNMSPPAAAAAAASTRIHRASCAATTDIGPPPLRTSSPLPRTLLSRKSAHLVKLRVYNRE